MLQWEQKMQDMRRSYGSTRVPRKLAVAAAVALLLASGNARAQLPTQGLSLGIPDTGSRIGGTGIPMGATEFGAGGLSPPPLGVVPGTSPLSSSMPGTTTGLGAPGSMMFGTDPSLGSGLSPGVSPPSGFGPPPPSYGITNYGTGGVQPLPGSPLSGARGINR